MKNLKLPFNINTINKIIEEHPTPFHIYDEKNIIKNINNLKKAFSWNEGFKNYYAVKALPNPRILQIMHENGFGLDCSSLPELILAEKTNFKSTDIMFTSNQTPAEEYIYANKLGAIINLDDINHIEYLKNALGKLPDTISFRYNPGKLKKGNAIIGDPTEAKYGLTESQIIESYKIVAKEGVKTFGIHTMVASNELIEDYFIETAEILFTLVNKIYKKLSIKIDFINLGGGLGIPYKPEEKDLDIDYIGKSVKKLYEKYLLANNQSPKIFMECGRYITGPSGYLISKVLHEKNIYKSYLGLDACATNLMRPSMYGAYHHITILGKDTEPKDKIYDVVGSLCENSDKFAINRALPLTLPGDIVVIHDTGAHGHAMGYNYNGKLRSAELLLNKNGSIELIRRAETIEDLFATLKI